jgi:hypothetical protein
VARTKATPYPLQVDKYVRGLENGSLFSAKDVYEALEHPGRHDYKSAIGQINQALVRVWAEGRLVSFADADGKLLREIDFVAPGSAAVEHPQLFALPDAPAPKGARAISKTEFDREVRAARRRGRAKETAAPKEEPDAAPDERAEPELPGIELLTRMIDFTPEGPAPKWIPDGLLAEWVSLPSVVRGLRRVLVGRPTPERRQLIMTGLQRKGDIGPKSQVVAALVKLCRGEAKWWSRVCSWAFQDSVEQMSPEHFPLLSEDLDRLRASTGRS